MTNKTGFPGLPRPDKVQGTARRIGVEIEFSGPNVAETCAIITDVLGGRSQLEDRFLAKVLGTRIGDIEVELDTSLSKKAESEVLKAGLELAEAVVPVEIVTEPLGPADLPETTSLIEALRRAGAKGSRSHLLTGYGVHLNPETTGDPVHTIRVVTAYGVLEDLLRKRESIDLTRRALPFVNPWPKNFVRDLIEDAPRDIAALIRLTARHIDSRNHGLDLFPLIKDAEPGTFAAAFPDDKTSARPAYHFRLPESRVDEDGWTLSQSWALWHLVEEVAEDPDLLDRLTARWIDAHAGWPDPPRGKWADEAEALLDRTANEVSG